MDADNKKTEPIWAVAANIVHERNYGTGGLEKRRGTKHFPAGAKVYCVFFFWGMGAEDVAVIGRHRATNRFVKMIIRTAWLTNFRVELVYSPTVIRLIKERESGDEVALDDNGKPHIRDGQYVDVPISWDDSDISKKRCEGIVSTFSKSATQAFITRPPTIEKQQNHIDNDKRATAQDVNVVIKDSEMLKEKLLEEESVGTDKAQSFTEKIPPNTRTATGSYHDKQYAKFRPKFYELWIVWIFEYKARLAKRKPPLAKKSKASYAPTLGSIFLWCLICAICLVFLKFEYEISLQHQEESNAQKVALMINENTQAKAQKRKKHHCDGRKYCYEMDSKAEAIYFMNMCDHTLLDLDHNGIPCESDRRFKNEPSMGNSVTPNAIINGVYHATSP